MKKTLYLFFLLITTGAYSQTSPSGQETELGDLPQTKKGNMALADPVVPSCNGSSLSSPYNQNNGSAGIMFDIVATNTVTVNYFDANLVENSTKTYEIWYRPGGFNGFEGSSNGWTLVGQAANITSNGANVPTRIPLFVGVTIPAGQTYGFYITNTSPGGGTPNLTVYYRNGSTKSDLLASDANLTILGGVGKIYPFANTINNRQFNGTVCYSIDCASFAPSVFTSSTAEGLTVQVSGGVQYERPKSVDRINGYEIRQTEQNQTGYFVITQPGPYSITATDAKGCRATVTGTF